MDFNFYFISVKEKYEHFVFVTDYVHMFLKWMAILIIFSASSLNMQKLRNKHQSIEHLDSRVLIKMSISSV